MASPQVPSVDLAITFFGTCPTSWDDLTPDQKESCIALVHLTRQIEGYYAWAAIGELARQWNENGYREYSAVIQRTKFQIRKSGVPREKIASHELRLLSTTPSRGRATPFVIITSKNIKEAREIVSRLEKHPRLCKFGLSHMAREGGLRFTAGDPLSTSPGPNSHKDASIPSDRHTVSAGSTESFPSDQPAGASGSSRGLCGARIAVYKHEGGVRGKKRNVATIGGVFRIGGKYLALTSAHVFFDNVASSGSWADSGLYVTADSSASQDGPRPVVSELYEIIVESFWPHVMETDGNARTIAMSMGLFEPQLTSHRKGPRTMNPSELIWNFEMDWALIELRDPLMWGSNVLQFSFNAKLELAPPALDQEPPTGKVLVAAGVSGPVYGAGLGTVGGIMLPWSSHETRAWSFEAEIAVGDCGSVVICPENGMTYGFVVAHDSETMMTYLIPALAIFESILAQCGLSDLPLQNLFSLTKPSVDSLDTAAESTRHRKAPLADFQRPLGDSILQEFTRSLGACTMRNADGKQYIMGKRLQQWFLEKSNRNASNLDLLLDYVYPQSIMLPVEPDNISSGSQKSLLVFSILLELGRGDLIDQFQRYHLTDRRLPFESQVLLHGLARLEAEDAYGLAQDFSKRQWAYCPVIFQYGVSVLHLPQLVFPIHQMQRINAKGGTATLWQIVVLEDYVDHRLREVASNARFSDPSDTLGHRYQFALKSYQSGSRRLFEGEVEAFHALRNAEGMIRYLGDYSVEFEDLKATHNILLEYGDLDLQEYFNEIQPPVLSTDITMFWRNISEIANAVSNIHQFTKRRAGIDQDYSGWHADIKPDNILYVQGKFKLSDPGFARFEKSGKDVTEVFGGTVQYGPPELSSKRRAPAQVSQAIDIWSLGCVFSEAATWLVLGKGGIRRFEQVRIEARDSAISHQHQSSLQRGGFFHDGKGLLKEVLDWHKLLRRCMRRSDEVTGLILDLLDHQVLLGDPAGRINIRDLCGEMDNIIRFATSNSLDQPRIFPALLRAGTDDNNMVVGWRTGLPKVDSIPSVSDSVQELKFPELSPLKLQESLALRALGSRNSLSLQSASNLAMSPSTSFRRWDSPPLSVKAASIAAASHLVIPPPPAERDSQREGMRTSASRTAKAPLQQTVSQAQAEMKKAKKIRFSLMSRTTPTDKFLARYLHNRDISFLVDNAESMKQYWTEVTAVLTTLMMKVSGIDEGGVDVFFTTGPIEVRACTKLGKLREAMEKKDVRPRPGLHTDMNRSLGGILSGYLHHIRANAKSTTRKQLERGFTLIVLTDGIWQGMRKSDALIDTIHRLTKSLQELQGHSLEQRLVSIEFVRFGDDRVAMDRLKFLDNDLAQSSGLPDIIDSTPAHGNVYKMLLGSILEEYDDDDDGEEES